MFKQERTFNNSTEIPEIPHAPEYITRTQALQACAKSPIASPPVTVPARIELNIQQQGQEHRVQLFQGGGFNNLVNGDANGVNQAKHTKETANDSLTIFKSASGGQRWNPFQSFNREREAFHHVHHHMHHDRSR